MKLFAHTFPTAIAPVFAAVDGDGRLVRLDFLGRPGKLEAAQAELARRGHALVNRAAPCAAVRAQVEEFVAGRRRAFELALAPEGTDFQLAVWRELQRIPYGETRSYAELAARVGRPRAVRAVGSANGANPLSLVVPCHRVIGSDGSLTGYGGGMQVKRALLELEGAAAASA